MTYITTFCLDIHGSCSSQPELETNTPAGEASEGMKVNLPLNKIVYI